MLQLILLIGSARTPSSPCQRPTRPGGADPGGTRAVPTGFQPRPGCPRHSQSRNVRSIFGPFCSHREQQTGGCAPAGPEPAAQGTEEPIRLPGTSGRLGGATAQLAVPGAALEPRSRAHPCLPALLLVLGDSVNGEARWVRGFKATVFRGVFPKDSPGGFPVTLGCDTPGAPGRDSPTPSQLCRVPLDTDSRSPKTFGGRDIKATTVMRSEGSRLGILSRSRESFGTEFHTFAGRDIKRQNPKKPKGLITGSLKQHRALGEASSFFTHQTNSQRWSRDLSGCRTGRGEAGKSTGNTGRGRWSPWIHLALPCFLPNHSPLAEE